MDRKTYWNETYLAYWKARVAESKEAGDSSVVSGDARTEGDEIYERIFSDHPFRPGTLLDIGCAWGRTFGIFKGAGLRISGVDISSAMIEAARKNWAGDDDIDQLEEAEAEDLPFADGSFDNVTCLGVFDATRQNESLGEMLRILRPHGLLYLTGKNHRYHDDDTLAADAEVGARKKRHPNFFTDTANMIGQLAAQGHKTVAGYYFPRRGDFATLSYLADIPSHFYEYCLVVEKGAGGHRFQPFSDDFSTTFRDSHKTG